MEPGTSSPVGACGEVTEEARSPPDLAAEAKSEAAASEAATPSPRQPGPCAGSGTVAAAEVDAEPAAADSKAATEFATEKDPAADDACAQATTSTGVAVLQDPATECLASPSQKAEDLEREKSPEEELEAQDGEVVKEATEEEALESNKKDLSVAGETSEKVPQHEEEEEEAEEDDDDEAFVVPSSSDEKAADAPLTSHSENNSATGGSPSSMLLERQRQEASDGVSPSAATSLLAGTGPPGSSTSAFAGGESPNHAQAARSSDGAGSRVATLRERLAAAAPCVAASGTSNPFDDNPSSTATQPLLGQGSRAASHSEKSPTASAAVAMVPPLVFPVAGADGRSRPVRPDEDDEELSAMAATAESLVRRDHPMVAPRGWRPAPTPIWQCGRQRQDLRADFNAREISAARLVRSYDRDGSGLLEHDELRRLLQDYNHGRPVRGDDVRSIVAIADMDDDGRISTGEVLYALRVWYAFTRMPKAVGAAFYRYSIGDAMMPSDQALRQLLQTLNDSIPISEEEAMHVRQMATHLGASEEHATIRQMRMAVAAWYLNIERANTGDARLLVEARESVLHHITASAGLLKNVLVGNRAPDPASLLYDDVHTGTLPCFCCVVATVGAGMFLIPFVEILVASAFPSDTCEQGLNWVLLWTGVVGLLAALSIALVVTVHFSRRYKEFEAPLLYTVACINVVYLGFLITGFSYVLRSSPLNCGTFLFEMSNFVYKILPFLILVLLIFGPCCTCWFLGLLEVMELRNADAGLMEP